MIVANAFVIMYDDIKLIENLQFETREELNDWYSFHTENASTPTTVILEGWFV